MILRHRNLDLLRFEWTESCGVCISWINDTARQFLPLAFGEIVRTGDARELEAPLAEWLCRRTAPMGRHFMRDLMASLGLNMRDPEFHRKALEFSKGLSLNDVHWVVPDDFHGTWEDCNLYANDFSKSMAEIAFTGHGLRSPEEATTSPEMTTNGMLPKCWRRVKGEILLCKAGSEASAVGSAVRGLEPYSEFYASQIAGALGFDHVSYGLAMFKGRLCSTCPIFTSEKIGYLPASNLENRASALGDPRFAPIFLFDALIFNTDRHLGNFGYLVDNATNTVCGVAPIFDNGYGLFSLAEDDSLLTSLRGRHPALFDGWLAFPGTLNENLLTALRRLVGFRFKRHQHYNLPAERLDRIQRILQKRVSDILKYGKDADRYVQIADDRVGVNSKGGVGCVGVNTEDLDPLALQILWNMKANPFVTARELAEVLAVEQRTIERRLRALREKRVLRRVGEDQTGYWEVLI